MSGLRELQLNFKGYLFGGEDEPVPRTIAGRSAAEQRRRMAIYADAYRMRLLEVLSGDYPAVKAVLGDAAFTRLALAYAERYPSTDPSLRWFGRHLPSLVAETCPDEPDAIAELARFEWLQAEVFDAPDGTPLTADALGEVPAEAWPDLVFRPHASVRHLHLEYATPQRWSAVTAGEAFQPRHSPGEWILWRSALDVHWRSLGEDESWALQGLLREEPFDAICGGLCQWHNEEEAAAAAVGLLQRWLADGLITHFQY